MSSFNIYIYIFIMAGVTYLIRALPMTIIRKEIKNPFIKSFLGMSTTDTGKVM